MLNNLTNYLLFQRTPKGKNVAYINPITKYFDNEIKNYRLLEQKMEELRNIYYSNIDQKVHQQLLLLNHQPPHYAFDYMQKNIRFPNNIIDFNCLWEMYLGIKNGLNISSYADLSFSWMQMHEIRLGLQKGVDVSIYANNRFNEYQMKQIRLGLQKGIDVYSYAYPYVNMYSMYEIRKGIESGVDVSKYVQLDYSWNQMFELRLGLEQGLDISKYFSIYFNPDQMKEVRLMMKRGIDVSKYIEDDEKYNFNKMHEYRMDVLKAFSTKSSNSSRFKVKIKK